MTEVIGHRGYPTKYPENTLTSFKAAVHAGADRIELDAHHTADRRLVCHHHSFLETPSGGEGLIIEQPYSYIMTLDVGSWFDPEFAGERIPLLDEVFDELKDTCGYELDMKGLDEEFLEDTVRLVRERDLMGRVEFASGNQMLLGALRRIAPDALLGMIVPLPEDWMMKDDFHKRYILSQLAFGQINVAHLKVHILDDDFMAQLREQGLRIHASDCNTEEDIRRAVELGVDQFTANDVELAVRVRDQVLGK